MRFNKKILTWSLACAMGLIFAGCDGETQISNVNIETTNLFREAGSWKISGLGTDTTAVTKESLAIQFGAQLAIDEINAEGGINGSMLEFSFLEEDNRFRLEPSGDSVSIFVDPLNEFLMSLPDMGNGEEYSDNSVGEDVIQPSFTEETEKETVITFVERYKQMYGSEPDQIAAAAYDSIYILKSVLEAAGVMPDMGMDEICDVYRKSMTGISYEGLTGTGMTWNIVGEASAQKIYYINGQGN